MAVEGDLLLAIWNDFDSARIEDYEEWHSREHVPERASVTGIHSGTRLRNDKLACHRYLTLYDIQDAAVLTGPEYSELLTKPTPCSATMRPGFRNFLRVPLRVVRSEGWGLGGSFAVVGTAHSLTPDNVEELIKLRQLPSLISVHVARREPSVAQLPWTQTAEAREIESLVLLEAVTATAAQIARDAAASILTHSNELLREDFANSIYQVAYHFPGRAANERLHHRRPNWESANA